MASSTHLSLLVSDFQALASETKRKHGDVKEAADKALALLNASPGEVLEALRCPDATPPNLAESIFRPISLACVSKNAKVVAIALGSLQRLIGMDAVPPSEVPFIVSILSSVLTLGVEIQLRILQTLPSLFTRCSRYLHDSLLADALLLCFRLQDSRIGVVSSTSAATLRQLVMVVFEGVAEEDKAVHSLSDSDAKLDATRTETDFFVDIPPSESVQLTGEAHRIDAHRVVLRPSAKDAYLVFEDLCLLVNGDSPSFLKLPSLPKTFGLELIESVMTGHGHLFQQHLELILVLRAQLCPLLIRALSEKPHFPLTLRLMRVTFLLLKQFPDDLIIETEIFLSLLIKIVSLDQPDGQAEPPPAWFRVLALEIFRGLCTDFDLLLKIFERYDLRRSDQSLGLFTSMMGAFNRLASEKPALLGINQDITFGSLSTYQAGPNSNPGVQGVIDGVVGIATQAAAPLVGTAQGGLAVATAAMKLQCIDQLDKAEAPGIPETYVYLLSLQFLSNVAEGFIGFALVQHEGLRQNKGRRSADASPGALFSLNLDDVKARQNNERLKVAKSMADASWPALLASLNFFVSTNLDDQLFNDTLAAMQSFTYVCGLLDLTTPRDAFLLSFCKFAVPPAIVANVASEISSGSSNKPSQGVLSADTLGLGATPVSTTLSSRNLAFLNTLLSIARYLTGVLGSTWYTVFETLQNADFVLTAKLKKRATQPSTSAVAPGAQPHEPDENAIQASIHKLFDCSRTMDSGAFLSFISELCRLSRDVIGLSSNESVTTSDGSETPRPPNLDMRRRVSGLAAFRTLRQNERSFGVTKLGAVSLLNIRRLILLEPEFGWDPITSHLLAVQRYVGAPHGIRLQAADALDKIVLSAPNLISNVDSALRSRVQAQLIAVLARQSEPDEICPTSTDIEVRKLGFDTLFKVLENNGHSFISGWSSVLDVLRTACQPLSSSSSVRPSHNSSDLTTPQLPNSSTSKLSILIRTSFPSLQLICTDFLTALDLIELRGCISVLTEFGRQSEDINVALTAGGLLWQVSDHVQEKNKSCGAADASYVDLWMFLLSKLLELSSAFRQEVRDGSIQTLFRTIGLYGSLLSPDIWHKLLCEVVFPLFELLSKMIRQTPSELTNGEKGANPGEATRQPNGVTIDLSAKQLDDSKILALRSAGQVISDHLSSHVINSSRFLEIWSTLVQHLYHSFTRDRPEVGATAMKTLATILNSELSGVEIAGLAVSAWEVAWDAFVKMGEVISLRPDETTPRGIYFTQESLVAYIQVSAPLQNAGHLEMSIARVKDLLRICKTVITYSHSPDYRPDVESMTPLMSAVVSAIDQIKLSATGIPSAVMTALAELATLAFTSPHQVPDPFLSGRFITVSFISLFGAVQPRLIKLLRQFCHSPDIYNSGAVTDALRCLSIYLRLKYGCPPASKRADAQPLWKTASSTFLTLAKDSLPQLTRLGSQVTPAAFESFWRELIEAYSGVLLADCKPAVELDLEQQREEENFDLAFLASLELDVLPYLGQAQVHDDVIVMLCHNIQSASRLYHLDTEDSTSQCTSIAEKLSHPTLSKGLIGPRECRFLDGFNLQAYQDIQATSVEVVAMPRERFSYWCFDLLFVFCSQVETGEVERKRVATLCLPILLNRCAVALKTFVVDASIRSQIPFPRMREEEISYILRQILSVKLSGKPPTIPQSFQTSESVNVDHTSLQCNVLSQAIVDPATAHLRYLQKVLIELLTCESCLIEGLKQFTCKLETSGGYPNGHRKTYRDLTQAGDRTGAGLDGRWPALVLGQVGCLNEKQLALSNMDIKALVLMCLERTLY